LLQHIMLQKQSTNEEKEAITTNDTTMRIPSHSQISLTDHTKAADPARWWVLALLCVVIYSFVYCYDTPFAIQNQLIDEYGLTETEYNLLYAVYGYINMIAPLFAGILVDWIGINSSTLIFYILIVTGQTLFVLACSQNISSLALMLIGRAIFGVGAEQFHLSRKWILFDYFSSTEYYLASAISLSFSRIGSASQSYINTALYNRHGIGAVLLIGLLLVVISFILLIAFLYIQKRHQISRANHANQTDAKHVHKPETDEKRQSQFTLFSLCRGGIDRRWWLLGLTLIFIYSAYLSYSNVGSAFLQNRYKYSYERANYLAPIAYWVSAVFTPVFGFTCDYVGRRAVMMMLSSLCLLIGHVLLSVVGSADSPEIVPMLGLVSLGLGYSLGASSLWPSVGMIVDQKFLANSLGIWGCIDNAFQATNFVIVGALTQDYSEEERERYTDQYEACRYYWIALSLAALLWSSLLLYYDNTMFDQALWKPSDKFSKDVITYEGVKNAEGLAEGTQIVV